MNVSAVAKSNHDRTPLQRVTVMASSSRPEVDDIEDDAPPSPDYYDTDYEDDEPAIVGGGSSKPDDEDLVPDISGDPGADAPSDEEGVVPADGEVQPEDEEVQDRADRHDPEME
jgi:hypothetical protein